MPIKKTGKPIADQLADYKRMHALWPKHVGTEAVKFFKSSFDRQGWQDTTFTKWKPVADSSVKKRHKKKGRKILIGTTRLKRSIRIVSYSASQVIVGTDVPYAKVHNEGFRGVQYVKPYKRTATISTTVQGSYQGLGRRSRKVKLKLRGRRHNVRGFGRRMNMPKRQFIGTSTFFDKRLQLQRDYKVKQALGIR